MTEERQREIKKEYREWHKTLRQLIGISFFGSAVMFFCLFRDFNFGAIVALLIQFYMMFKMEECRIEMDRLKDEYEYYN